jgi:acyl-CoA synthetase (AMP-forming)/AMP-acid ligase II
VHRGARYDGGRWFTGYEPATFAGLQVVLQAVLTGGCLVLPDRLDGQEVAHSLAEHAVEYASATPSYWRMFLAATTKPERALVHLRQITMGGEAVDQPLLDALRAAFPATRLAHIYASTEMGACFAVTDGRAGFPRTFLDDDSLPCRLAISEDGELLIRPGRGQEARDTLGGAGWFSSGDLVEVDEDRVLFVGRREDCINVGGRKVFPVLVEDVIRSVEGVSEVRVRPLKSSLLGQLVAAEVEASPEADQAALRTAIVQACRMRLARHAVPAQVMFTGHLERTPSGKVARGPLASP